MKVNEYTQQYKSDRTPQNYLSNNVPYQAFRSNADVSKAIAYASKSVSDTLDFYLQKKQADEKNNILEFGNEYDVFSDELLYNKDTGYYTTSGKNAIDNYDGIWQQLNDKAQSILENANLSDDGKQKLKNILDVKKQNLYQGLNNFAVQNRKIYEQNVISDTINNTFTKAIHNRYDDNQLAGNLRDINTATSMYAQSMGLDEAATSAIQKKNIEQFHINILNQMLADNDDKGYTNAVAYLDKNKDSLSAENYTKISEEINRTKNKLKTERDKAEEKRITEQIYNTASNEEEAISLASKIDDVEKSDAIISRLKVKYSDARRFEEQNKKDVIKNFYDDANLKLSSGQSLSYDMINPNLDGETQLALKNFIDKNGSPETDNQIWQTLYDMRVNNAQGFAAKDLNVYRGYLSEGDFKYFIKEQENIKNGGYYTTIKDDDAMINAALKSAGIDLKTTSWFGLTGNQKEIAYSEIRSYVREFEARKARKITNEELSDFITSLGYEGEKGTKLYKDIEKGMREKVGFLKDVVNDFVYYQSKHNGQMPSDEEKYKIIKNRVIQKKEEKKTRAEQIISNYTNNANIIRNIQGTSAKQDEQKGLTYFADTVVPQISKDLGLNLNVTSRYRNQKGSHHSEGRALDIGLAKFNANDRIRIYEKLINNPQVEALGCSDVNILAHFGHRADPKHYNPKIVDERNYDKKHGTNHENHVHITLYWDNDKQIALNAQNGIYKL